jgi:hypothetical protein
MDGFGHYTWLDYDKANFELTFLFNNYPYGFDITFVWKTVCGIEMGKRKENILELYPRKLL